MKEKILKIVALICVLSMTLITVPVMAAGPVPVTTETVGTATTSVNIRDAAGGGSIIGSIPEGATMTILGTSSLWYRVSYNGLTGYVYYEYVTVGSGSPAAPSATPGSKDPSLVEMDVNGTVTGNSVNVRKGAGTKYDSIGKLNRGNTVHVTGSVNGWYRIDYSGKDAYVSGAYVTLASQPAVTASAAPTGPNATVVLDQEGDTVKLRSGPGTGYDAVGTVAHNERITVLDASSTWYKISHNGAEVYINGAYVVLDGAAASASPAATATPSGTPAASPTPAQPAKGKVTASNLMVRAKASSTGTVLGKLPKGTVVEIKGKTNSWLIIDYQGQTAYISGAYVEVTGTIPSATPTPSASPTPAASSTPGKADDANATVEVEGGGSLNVRKGPGSDYEKVGKVSNGARIRVTGSSNNWYAFDFNGGTAYVSKNYVVLDSEVQLVTTPSASAAASNIGTVTASTLNVRSGAGTNYSIIGKLKCNDTITILGTSGIWYKINFDGKNAYVSSAYVTVGSAPVKTSSSPSANEMVNRTLDIETTLSEGSTGDKVKDLQKALNIHGFYNGDIDGVYGSALKSAVSAFQKAAGLDVDGKAGNYTLATAYTLLDPLPKAELNLNAYSNGSNIPIIKPTWSEANTLLPRNASFVVVDVRTGYTFACIRTGGSKHADVEPATREDTNIMYYACGSKWSWTRRPIWVVYNGMRMAASMNCQPHGYETVGKNDMTGQFCIHFVNSRTHGSDNVDPDHQACIEEAYKAGQ